MFYEQVRNINDWSTMPRAAQTVSNIPHVDGVSSGAHLWRQERQTVSNGINVPGLEGLFPSGLSRSLHVLEAETAQDGAILSAFPLAFAHHLSPPRPIAWVTQSLAAGEAGQPYGPGLAAFGHDPFQFIFVTAPRAADVLWAIEECLRSLAVGAVVGELNDRKAIDLTATRRLAMRCERADVPAFLLSHLPLNESALAARSRWRIGPGKMAGRAGLLGEPAFAVNVVKNRDGFCARRSLTLACRSGVFAPFERKRAAESPALSPETSTAHETTRSLVTPAVLHLAERRRHRDHLARMRS